MDWAAVLAGDVAPWAVVAAIAIAVYRGKLIPSNRLEREIDIMEKRLSDKDTVIQQGTVREGIQQQTIDAKQITINTLNNQLTAMGPLINLLQKVLRALPPMDGDTHHD